MTLREAIAAAENKKVALGHFNVADLAGLKAVFNAARKLNLPVIVGVSEGEREFLGTRQIAALVRSLRAEYDFPVFLNADHTHSLEKIEEAAVAGFDAVIADGSQLSFEENIAFTKKAAQIVRHITPDILIEGELGYIGSGSVILERVPAGAAIGKENFTTPEDAARFVKETGVDMLAPAVGNLHGMLADRSEPHLDISRIGEIKSALRQVSRISPDCGGRAGQVGVPLVLHGGSGTPAEDFTHAIEAGITIIHISTELRIAWRRGLEKALKEHPEEIVPYRILNQAVAEIESKVLQNLEVFNRL